MRRAASRLRPAHIALSAAALLAGCEGVARASADEVLREAEDLQLCAAYGEAAAGQRDTAAAEIRHRGLLTGREWEAAAQGTIFVGMTACGLLASRGDPRPAGAIERLGFRTGPYLQWVYRSDPRMPPLYIYTDNGRIIGWQQ